MQPKIPLRSQVLFWLLFAKHIRPFWPLHFSLRPTPATNPGRTWHPQHFFLLVPPNAPRATLSARLLRQLAFRLKFTAFDLLDFCLWLGGWGVEDKCPSPCSVAPQSGKFQWFSSSAAFLFPPLFDVNSLCSLASILAFKTLRGHALRKAFTTSTSWFSKVRPSAWPQQGSLLRSRRHPVVGAVIAQHLPAEALSPPTRTGGVGIQFCRQARSSFHPPQSPSTSPFHLRRPLYPPTQNFPFTLPPVLETSSALALGDATCF